MGPSAFSLSNTSLLQNFLEHWKNHLCHIRQTAVVFAQVNRGNHQQGGESSELKDNMKVFGNSREEMLPKLVKPKSVIPNMTGHQFAEFAAHSFPKAKSCSRPFSTSSGEAGTSWCLQGTPGSVRRGMPGLQLPNVL